MNAIRKKFRFKITIIGDGMVGKTSLIKKFTKSSFRQGYVKTIGAQFSVFDKEINEDKIKLLFWDIAGQVDFNFLRPTYYKNSQAGIIVYSLEDNDIGKKSFKHIVNWYRDISKYCGEIPVVIFANKVDLVDENDLNTDKIQNIVNKHNFLGYYLTSAKTGKNVITAFNAIINELYYKFKASSSV